MFLFTLTFILVFKENQREKMESNATFAARLGKSILLEKYPNIDRNALLDLFSDNNNSLHDTVATLHMNQECDTNLNDWELQLLEKAKQEMRKEKNVCILSLLFCH